MSQLEVDKIIPQSGTTLTIGETGDTISFASGVLPSLESLTITGDLTVDTDTLYVDSTNNRVGVKNASPTVELDVTGEAKISGDLTVDTDTLYVDSTNNEVGIGTTSPANVLHVSGSSTYVAGIEGSSAFALMGFKASGTTGTLGDANVAIGANGDDLYFRSGGAERARIDSSGNLLVGTTDTDPSNDTSGTGGIALGAASYISLARANSTPLLVNRIGTDGETILFKKDGSTVGSISVSDGDRLNINSGSLGLKLYDDSLQILPSNGAGTNADNVVDIGASTVRFNDAYITNGVTTGSDQNEKQSIQSLTASEMAVAKRISQGFKTFKWNSAVEQKGDNARTHTGVIAQEVQQAFADEGLDAGNYGMFISNTWWEKEISVDAVAEELDEEGNIVVEGKDAYTYIDTKEEATEGYTQRTRLGIRYPELLSFVSSAFEQRLTNIETRLETLENE